MRGRDSDGLDGVVCPVAGDRVWLFVDGPTVGCHELEPELLDEAGGFGVAGTASRLFVVENAEGRFIAGDDVATDEDVDAVAGRRWITVFTVTRLVSLEGGSNGMVDPEGFESTRKALVLFGIGGIIRA